MDDTPNIAPIAALLGDPTRARMLVVLMDGRSRTATELALEGRVTPSTASSHLARLTEAGLVTITKQGRYRHFRLANPEVAAVIEALMGMAPGGQARSVRPGGREEGLRWARVCYDHLAGQTGVRLLERLREVRLVNGSDELVALTRSGEEWCAGAGIDLKALHARRRRVCRSCLDWSERRMHLAGSLGAAILDRLFGLRYARRVSGSRAIVLSPRGEAFIEQLKFAR